MTEQPARQRERVPMAVILFGLLFPGLMTWIYFIVLADAPPVGQKAAFLIGKAIQFGFPIVWVLGVCREKIRLGATPLRGVAEGVGFGMFVSALMLVGYHLWLKPFGLLDPSSPAAGEVWRKISGFGVTGAATYFLLGSFYSLCHSGMEEYYWRWFVFGQLRKRASLAAAIWFSSLGFVLHHVLVLGFYFGFASPATWLLSGAVGVGGLYWAWLYQRSDSLLGPWLGHLLIDAAIFLVGYDLIQPMLTSG